ncbi:hypothetical protein AB0G73_23955 [Streptomyces sp. NPDC020719]|uniref:hypothetical protein n=1 Tax=Streptomyces sp. NPDC020719 TaxID=3154896 RepID=UPI00340DEDE6
MKTYRLAWKMQDGAVRTSAVSYSMSAAEDRREQLAVTCTAVRVVEVPIGQDIPSAVIKEMSAEG